MKKIITAVDNPNLNLKLKQEKEIKIIGKDIQYKEGIIEFLEKNKNIDLIIISEELQGEITTEELIKKIKKINNKIKIYYILEKENKQKEKMLKELYINKIYYNNKISIKEIIKILKEEEENKEEMKKEIEKLKRIIEKEKNKKNILNKILKIIKNKIKKYNKIKNKILIKIKKYNIKKEQKNNKINKFNKVININFFKKSKINLFLINYLAEKNNKILILKINKIKKRKYYKIKNKYKKIINKKYKKRNIKTKKIKKIKRNIFIKEIFDSKNILKANLQKIEKYLEFFDYIIVYTKEINKKSIIQELIKKGAKTILIIESNLLGIKESLSYIEKLEENRILNKKSLHIVASIDNKQSIIKELIKKFYKFSNSLIYIKKENEIKNVKKIYNKIIKI